MALQVWSKMLCRVATVLVCAGLAPAEAQPEPPLEAQPEPPSAAEPSETQELPIETDYLAVEIIGLQLDVPLTLLSPSMNAEIYSDGRGGQSAHFATADPDTAFVVLNLARSEPEEAPFEVVAASYADAPGAEITYEVDKPHLGVVSGFLDDIIFYELCKAAEQRFYCLALEYPERDRALVDHTIERMVRSLGSVVPQAELQDGAADPSARPTSPG